MKLVNRNSNSHNAVVIHVDGSSRGNPGLSGFGCVVRTGDGQWIEGCAGFVSFASNLQVELHSIWNGMKWLQKYNISMAWCFTNSREALWIINKVTDIAHYLYPLIKNIANLWKLHPRWRWEHILREGNTIADVLAWAWCTVGEILHELGCSIG